MFHPDFFLLSSHIFGKTDGLQSLDHIPPDIHLPPVLAELRRGRLCMVIPMPVLAPCRHLQRTEPPDVLAGIDAFRQSGFKVKEAVHEALHMEAVEQTDGAEPEKAGPAEEEISEKERHDNERNLKLCPDGIPRPHHIRAPLLHARRFPLIQPPQMRPPESSVPWARDVVNRIRFRMMIPVVRDPGAWSSRTVETCKENENLLNDRVQLDCAMRQPPVISNGCSEAA